MTTTNTKSQNKFEIHAEELAAAIKSEQEAQDRLAEVNANLSTVMARLNKGEDVQPTKFVEARAAVEIAELVSKAKTNAVKSLRANAPWDPILAEALAKIVSEGFPGLKILCMDRRPDAGLKVDAPTLVLSQTERARPGFTPGQYTGTVFGTVVAPEYMAGLFDVDRRKIRKLLEESRRGRFKLDDAMSSEMTFRAHNVYEELPRFGRGPAESDAVSAAESMAQQIVDDTQLSGRYEEVHINGNRHMVNTTTVKAKPFGGKIVSVKKAGGKRITTVELYLNAWANPNLEGISKDAGRSAVEREAQARVGSVLYGIGRVTSIANIGRAVPEGEKAEAFKVTLVAESTAE